MICYAESSAVLSWLQGEGRGREILGILRRAEKVVSSDLTLLECDRGLRRRVAEGTLTEAEADKARALLAAAEPKWDIVPLTPRVIGFGRRTFPVEPVRPLDALHLGTALFVRTTVPDLRMVTLDARVSSNARLLGLPVEPGTAR